MKALTICQPYAELIVRGDKPIENRSWRTRYRGEIAIHAGQSRDWLHDDGENVYGIDRQRLAFGAIVGTATVVACLPLFGVAGDWGRWSHLLNHEHAHGPWCWILEDVRRLPIAIPCRGARGLWTVPEDIEAQVCESLGRTVA